MDVVVFKGRSRHRHHRDPDVGRIHGLPKLIHGLPQLIHVRYTVDNRVGILLDYALNDTFESLLIRPQEKAQPVCINRISMLKLSALPSSSRPTILLAESKERSCTAKLGIRHAYILIMKQMTQGKL